MQTKPLGFLAFAFLALAFLARNCLPGTSSSAQAQTPYATMAPLAQYMIPDQNAEIALARSAAPKSISDRADIMVLGPSGYTTAVKGTNGFLCMVQRSWSASTDFPEFWNPKLRAPICWNSTAAKTYGALVVMKTKWVLAGKSKAEIGRAVTTALDKKELSSTGPGAIAYMMSKQQYLNDEGKMWHPHLMFLIAGHAPDSWGENLPGSPILSDPDPEERITFVFVLVPTWSDGTPASQMTHSH